MGKEKGLTPIRLQAINLLASGVEVTEVARACNVDRSTIYRWMNELEFARELETVANQFAQELLFIAINQIKEVLKTGRNSDRLKAAELVLNLHNKGAKGNTQNINLFQKVEKEITIDDILKEIEGM